MPKWVSEVRQFFSSDFLYLNCLNYHLASLPRCKTAFSLNIIFMIHAPTKHTQREMALGKKVSFLIRDSMSG